MGLFDRVKQTVSSKAWPGAAEWIPFDRVWPRPDPAPSPFSADGTYLRVWVSDIHLSHSRKWFTDWHPVVHAAVARRYGNAAEESVAVISPAAIPGFEKAAAATITAEKELTPLLPFPGGTVSINVGLVGVKGDNTVRELIDVVGSFGGIITSTALSTATTIATQVVDGFEKLFHLGDDVGTLAYDGTLALAGGGAPVSLAPGYLALFDAPVDPRSLIVREGKLVSWPGQGATTAVAGNFMLLRIESRVKRDEWQYLTPIGEPLQAARKTYDAATKQAFYQQAIAAARTSPDLHEADRVIISEALKVQKDNDVGMGATAEGLADDLETLAENATMSVEDALETRPTLASLLA